MPSRPAEPAWPVGAALPGWREPSAPARAVLEGHWCRLEPLEPARHATELHEAFATDAAGRMWTYLAYGPFASATDYRAWLEHRATGRDPLFFAIRSRESGRAVGVASYLRIDPPAGTIEIGHLAFSPLLQRRPAATEALYLLLRQAFALGYRRCEWKCDALNEASNRAARRLGFRYEGRFRQATVSKGRNRDTAWYSILDREWPALEAALGRWLDPANFDAGGMQRTPLGTFTTGAGHGSAATSQAPLAVFWQPGCSSCLKVREFLRSRGLAFESLNVRESPEALGRLEALGARSVPVVARGPAFVLGQDLDAVARFVGVPLERDRLAEAELAGRLERLLLVAAGQTRRLPETTLLARPPGRARTVLELAYHASQVAVAYLDAAAGGRLCFEHFERRPPEWLTRGADVAAVLTQVAGAVRAACRDPQPPRDAWLDTYYGRQPRHAVLERTTWHVAQHLRQLGELLLGQGLEPDPPLADALLAGLPLPAAVWDTEATPT